jgi:hypothetical protein
MSTLTFTLIVFFVSGLVFSIAIAVGAMRETLPSGVLLGTAVLSFWLIVLAGSMAFGKRLFPMKDQENQTNEHAAAYFARARKMGTRFLVTGPLGILASLLLPRQQLPLLMAGIVVSCLGLYLVTTSKKFSSKLP